MNKPKTFNESCNEKQNKMGELILEKNLIIMHAKVTP